LSLSLLILLFHYNSIHSLVKTIEIEKGKREDLISNLIINNIDYKLSFIKGLLADLEKST
jgi:hypothetical protein